MRLIWTYSKEWKKGENISRYPHEYIQYLYKRSITSASNSYHKIIYTDEENINIFKDIVDEVIIREPKPFVFLADLKFEIAELLQGEMLITDGDIFYKKKIKIPENTLIGFEVEIQQVRPEVSDWKNILLKHGIGDKVPIWNIKNSGAINLGLMYFNHDNLRTNLIKEYNKTQKFFIEHIEPIYNFNKNNKQFSACGSQMLVKQFLISQNINPYLFMKGRNIEFIHYSSSSKVRYLQLFNETI